MSGPFKMKGSPMKRNFGIGASPAKKRSLWQRAKDEGKQIIAGIKNISGRENRASDEIRSFKEGYATETQRQAKERGDTA
jgi:hypothetical protein